MPPPFISLDGLDGAGKSIQCRLLAQWLREQGRGVTECADPGGTAIGQVLRDLLLGHRQEISVPCEALLFMASRAQLVAEVIRPALTSGNAVVSDRFLLANVVYQGYAGGLGPEQLWQTGLLATQGLMPDLTFVLDLTVEQAMVRRKSQADRLESRALDFHERVRQGFLAEARRQPHKIRVVDATRPIGEIQEEIRMQCHQSGII